MDQKPDAAISKQSSDMSRATGEECLQQAGRDDGELSVEERERRRARNEMICAMDDALADIRQRSYEGKLTRTSRWKKMAFQPKGMDARAFEEQMLLYIEQRDHADDAPAIGKLTAPRPLKVQLGDRQITDEEELPDLDVSDIVLIYGKKGIYLYSKALMSHSYAHALYQTAEDSDIATFVDVVRSESRVYPRPVAADIFMNVPYLWPVSKTLDVYEQVKSSGAFADICMTRTSRGEAYFYSSLYLSDAQGKALAEWYGVERGMNP